MFKSKSTIQKSVATLVSVATITGITFGAYDWADTRYARAESLKRLETRIALNEVKTTYRDALADFYFYKNQAKKYPRDADIQQKLKESEEQVADLKKQMKDLETRKPASE